MDTLPANAVKVRAQSQLVHTQVVTTKANTQLPLGTLPVGVVKINIQLLLVTKLGKVTGMNKLTM